MKRAFALVEAWPLLRWRLPALCRRMATFLAPTICETAEEAFAFLDAHNRELLNDGKENILDDYCALMAATELYRATQKATYGLLQIDVLHI